ncbi:MAG: prephenate dehydrogenase/arogenate dehydrogenase family protein [Deltaproteobacteria bacterium]|nr:prephenate dehydrogenase/arogenate dehydrogenase family protein [Deltaproteobacteria bacterium]
MFQRIGIIGGLGIMGSMFEGHFKSHGIDVLISDKEDHAQEKHLVLESELIIISVPIEETTKVIRRIKPWLTNHQLLSDFTSVKNKIVHEMLETEADVISCHPMFGRLADVKGQNIILLPARPGKYLSKLKRLYALLGLNVVVMEDWEKHDESMSVIQGLMHFIHIVFTQTLKSKNVDLNALLEICSPVYKANFAFACRILQRDPHLYTHILMDNPENISVLNRFISQAHDSLKLIQQKDETTFEKHFLEYREFLGDLTDVFSEQSDFLIDQLKNFHSDQQHKKE